MPTMTAAPRAPVKYTVLARSLIGNTIYEEGQTAEYDGLPAENLAPTCDEGRARAIDYADSNTARIAKMRADNPEAGGMDAAAFGKAVAAAIAKSNAEHAEQLAALTRAMNALADKVNGTQAAKAGKKAETDPALA